MLMTAPQTEPAFEPTGMRVKVLYDSNPFREGWAVATLESDTQRVTAVRWKTGGSTPATVLQQSRHPENWFVLPDELATCVLEAAQKLQAAKHEGILRGYQEMAADEEREKEALEWSEALIGDGLETR